ETARLAGVSKMTVIRVCNGNHKRQLIDDTYSR
ncbi:LacI family DNA-binding transcriptional regulator, partial [Salmonella enterica subsp. enterica serovar Infantis]|nr:LacI family DNA-binding transcriptional regulator [Salmonella enterica subsp. enterica serovar Infantis]